MAQQNIENFWNMCEYQLKHYTTQFNEDMGPNWFKVEYKVVDKMSIEVIYILIMHCHEYSAHRGDVLLTSMYVPQEVITNLKELLHEIQE